MCCKECSGLGDAEDASPKSRHLVSAQPHGQTVGTSSYWALYCTALQQDVFLPQGQYWSSVNHKALPQSIFQSNYLHLGLKVIIKTYC